MRRRLAQSIQCHQDLLIYIDEDSADSPLDGSVEGALAEHPDCQQDVLIHIVGRFWSDGALESAEEAGPDRIARYVCDAVARRRQLSSGQKRERRVLN